ncbi:mus81 structure-specific endonuclease subunit isoform X2 [Megachile rotundata]|uniref:mus81 structure-specific endonuclease subunit isoform X2 n=1 Tax=Megachile rotundata TaxID=143995 RepID=UPI003FD13C28
MKRVKVKSKKPNPLFERWLEEWRKEAASRNSDLQHHFSKALSSLRKYPLPLKSGKDCIILQHFGKKICLMLDRKLKEYNAQNKGSDFVCTHCDFNEHASPKKCKLQEVDTNDLHERTELALFDKLNLLAWDVEKYAALLTLYRQSQDPFYIGFINEVDLLFEMINLCNRASKDSVFHLVDNGLISMIDDPIRYNLTEHGINVAKKMCKVAAIDVKLVKSSKVLNQVQSSLKSLISKKATSIVISDECSTNVQNDSPSKLYKSKSAEFLTSQKQSDNFLSQQISKKGNIHTEKAKKRRNVNNCELNEASKKTNSTNNIEKDICLKPNKFDIILLVDTQETCGVKTKPQHDATIAELTELGVLFEVRHLKVGDFTWIARCRITNDELILPYIVERKRIDDLSASITDGRFHEQKFRLKQSGITNLMYIIEEYKKDQRLTIPYASLMQASINTLIQDGFLVKYTKNHQDSMFYLSSLTKILIKTFKEKNLIGCKKEDVTDSDISSDTCNLMEFKEFNKAASKQKVFKVNQMFVRHLLQLKGMSVDKASAIVERYPTPRKLIDAYQMSDCNAELLLANIEYGNKKSLIGPTIKHCS